MGRQTKVQIARIGVKNDRNNNFNKTYERSTWMVRGGIEYAKAIYKDHITRSHFANLIESDEELKSGYEKINISRSSSVHNRESISIHVARPPIFYRKLAKIEDVVEDATNEDEKISHRKGRDMRNAELEARSAASKSTLVSALGKKLKKAGIDMLKNCELRILQSDKPEINATLIAKRVAESFENRENYSKVLRNQEKILQYACSHGSINGAKIEVAGRLNGAAIARAEKIKVGSVAKDTLDRAIDYSVICAHTQYGCIGIRVWIDHKVKGGFHG